MLLILNIECDQSYPETVHVFCFFSFYGFCILLSFSYGNFNIFLSIAVVAMHLILLNSGVNRKFTIAYTAWKVPEYGLFSGPYFPVFGLNAEIYSVNAGKYAAEETPYLDNFRTVLQSLICQKFVVPFSFHRIFMSQVCQNNTRSSVISDYFHIITDKIWIGNTEMAGKRFLKVAEKIFLPSLAKWYKVDLYILYKIQKQLFRSVLQIIKCK